jgi:hypothetical protein
MSPRSEACQHCTPSYRCPAHRGGIGPAPWFYREVHYGTYAAPPAFYPPEPPPPLYPEAIGRVVREVCSRTRSGLNCPAHSGPVTHTFLPPGTRYDADGNAVWSPIPPSLTITRRPPPAFDREPYEEALKLASRSRMSSIGYSAACGTK